MLFDSYKSTPEFPEFMVEDDSVYILDQIAEDDDTLESRGNELVERNSMDVECFKIKVLEGMYALYIGNYR